MKSEKSQLTFYSRISVRDVWSVKWTQAGLGAGGGECFPGPGSVALQSSLIVLSMSPRQVLYQAVVRRGGGSCQAVWNGTLSNDTF